MDISQFLTPELKTAIKTLAGAAGLESALGAVSNNVVKHQSVVIGVGAKVFRALAVVFGSIGNGLDRVQDYGGKISVERTVPDEVGKVDS